jgi:hypothetical protein
MHENPPDIQTQNGESARGIEVIFWNHHHRKTPENCRSHGNNPVTQATGKIVPEFS